MLHDIDYDCCAGADYSEMAGLCANGFTRTETNSCGHGLSWCYEHGCKQYTCEKSSPCVEYIGCFIDQTEGADFRLKASEFPSRMTYADGFRVSGIVSECANYCRRYNYVYAAVQGTDVCYCGNSYPSDAIAEEKSCGKDPSKGLAMSCGDGNAQTCVNFNAVYRLIGTEYCCDYNELDGPTIMTKYKWTLYLTIYILLGVGCAIIFFVGPCIIAYRKHLMKKVPVYPANLGPVIPATGVTVASPAVVMSLSQPVVVTPEPAAANVNVQPTVTPAKAAVDPVVQTSGVVVAQSTSNPTL